MVNTDAVNGIGKRRIATDVRADEIPQHLCAAAATARVNRNLDPVVNIARDDITVRGVESANRVVIADVDRDNAEEFTDQVPTSETLRD